MKAALTSIRANYSARSQRPGSSRGVTWPWTPGSPVVRPPCHDYEGWAAVLSIGQDRRWRDLTVDCIMVDSRYRVLDVVEGTGLITRRLAAAWEEAGLVALVARCPGDQEPTVDDYQRAHIMPVRLRRQQR